MKNEIVSNVLNIVVFMLIIAGFIAFNAIVYSFFGSIIEFGTGLYDTLRSIGATICIIGLSITLISAIFGKSKEKS